MSFGKHITLNTGAKIPQVGLGTWQAAPGEVAAAVKIAVKNGYCHLDLAHIYQNQKEIGVALKELFDGGVVKREDLFITSKLWNNSHQPAEVPKALDETLADLQLDYLDLYLIHWPVAFPPGEALFPADPANPGQVILDTETSLVDTWKAVIALPKGKVRSVGVSNFTIDHVDTIIRATGRVPAVNQLEAHPLLPLNEIAAHHAKLGIHITAYSSFGNNSIGRPLLTAHPVVQEIAKKLGANEGQVLIAWIVRLGFSVIPKSVKESRIIANFQQIELSQEDFEKVTAIREEKPLRYNIPYTYTPRWNINIFNREEEANAGFQVKAQ